MGVVERPGVTRDVSCPGRVVCGNRGRQPMERRKFIIGAGALATGSSAAMGTGALSSMSAERSATVDVVSDDSALVQLDPGASERVQLTNGELNISFANGGSGSGINVNSVYQVGSLKFSGLENVLSDTDEDHVPDIAPNPNAGSSPSTNPAFFVRNGDSVPQSITIEYEFDNPGTVSGSKVMFGSRVDNNQSGGVVGTGSPTKTIVADSSNTSASMTYDGNDALSSGAQIGVSLLIDTTDGNTSENLSGTLTVTANEVSN